MINWFLGYYTVTFFETFPEAALNACAQAGLTVTQIIRGKDRITLTLPRRDFAKFEAAMKKSSVCYSIDKKTGLPFLAGKYRRRYAMLLGAVLTAASLMYASSFVWSIEVRGNQTVSADDILETLDELGFHEGAKKNGFEYYQLYQKAILKQPQLAWMSINISGTKAVVEVLERELPPVIDDNAPCNIIAKESGVITDLKVYSGTPLVSAGTAVEKGDILVISTVKNLDETVREVPAKAEIYAETQYVFEHVCHNTVTESYETGKVGKKYVLKVFDFAIKLGANSRIPMQRYDKITLDRQLSLGNEFYLPVHLICDEYRETALKETKIDFETQVERAREAIKSLAESVLADVQIIDAAETVESYGTDVKVTVRYSCRENIAVRTDVAEDKR